MGEWRFETGALLRWAPRLVLAVWICAAAACATGPFQTKPQAISDFDGEWEFTFTSSIQSPRPGVRCMDGTGFVTVKDGAFIGGTFHRHGEIMAYRGVLQGLIVRTEEGVFLSIAESQSGRDFFTARIDPDAPGMSGEWEDMYGCRGTFSSRRIDAPSDG